VAAAAAAPTVRVGVLICCRGTRFSLVSSASPTGFRDPFFLFFHERVFFG
jgi:hypothetical protein